jgi:hypothetical protein
MYSAPPLQCTEHAAWLYKNPPLSLPTYVARTIFFVSPSLTYFHLALSTEP